MPKDRYKAGAEKVKLIKSKHLPLPKMHTTRNNLGMNEDSPERKIQIADYTSNNMDGCHRNCGNLAAYYKIQSDAVDGLYAMGVSIEHPKATSRLTVNIEEAVSLGGAALLKEIEAGVTAVRETREKCQLGDVYDCTVDGKSFRECPLPDDRGEVVLFDPKAKFEYYPEVFVTLQNTDT